MSDPDLLDAFLKLIPFFFVLEDDDDAVDDEEEELKTELKTVLVAEEDLVAEAVDEDDNACLPLSSRKSSCCRVSRDG